MRIPWFLLVVLFCAGALVGMGCTARNELPCWLDPDITGP
jgi:hypothetical protein